MKITISFETARTLFMTDDETAAQAVKQAGFDGVDLAFCESELSDVLTPQWEENVKNQVAAIYGVGLEISQCHLHYQPSHELVGDGSYKAFESVFLPVWLKEIQLCSEIGCKVAVAHLFFCDDAQETYLSNINLLEKLLPVLQRNDVILAIENTYGWGERYGDCGTTTAEQLLRYAKHFASPYIGICLDTGHAMCTRSNPIEMARQMGAYLKATHINCSSGRDTHLLLGALAEWIDPTDFSELSRVLRNIGYKGTYNLEVSPGEYPRTEKVGQYFLRMAAEIASYYARLVE